MTQCALYVELYLYCATACRADQVDRPICNLAVALYIEEETLAFVDIYGTIIIILDGSGEAAKEALLI